jgi:hypothetical protein
MFVTNLVPGGLSVKWNNTCFADTSGSMAATGSTPGHYRVTIDAQHPDHLFCSDSYVFATVEGLMVKTIDQGTNTFDWNVSSTATAAERWDVETKGLRVMSLRDDILQSIVDIIETALLFVPELTQGVPTDSAQVNLEFLAKYAQVNMEKRTVSNVPVPVEDIHSGDFFGVIRLDGLDPMLAWAMGSTTGHTTVALELEDGQMHICESTAKDSYWPVNGIQCTPYAQWVDQALAAGYNVVHAPLTAEKRAAFNATAAQEFFRSTEGLDYGYHNMLYGWIDTETGNYPCLPPDYSSVCLTWEAIEVLFALVDKLVPSIGDLMWNQALNHRLGTQGLRTAEIWYTANKAGITTAKLPTLPELDTWRYNTTRYNADNHVVGRSMVCCVFVCHIWKAAGLFDNLDGDVNCGEQTNFDDYSLTLLDPTPAISDACKAANPGSPICQLTGNYTLQLNDYAARTPYAWMDQECPSLAPHYDRPSNC